MAGRAAEAQQRIKVGGILTYPDLWLFGVVTSPDRPGVASAIFRALGREGLNVQLIVQSISPQGETYIRFCASRADAERILEILHAATEHVPHTRVDGGLAACVVCIYGPDFRVRPGIAGLVFDALAAASINILAISTSISTVSCVVEEARGADATRALQEAFTVP